MVIYLTEPGSVIRKDGGKLVVQQGDRVIDEIPSAKAEGLVVSTGAHVTSPVTEFKALRKNGVLSSYK
jgi:CRISPR/Cas system-associated endonuclease Cas1